VADLSDFEDRAAAPEDVGQICLSLPEVEFGTTWGDRPTYKVPTGEKGRGFCLYRAPRRDAINPQTGEEFADLLVIVVPNAEAKSALVGDSTTPFFTIDHFNGYNAVLIQESRLAEISVTELREVLTDAWRARAPKRLVRSFELSQVATDG
jgi:hypothetical protein